MKINNLFSVSGKIALVTGGSRGIGEMIASGYLANGCKVYITARNMEECTKTALKLSETFNAKCIAVESDLSNMDGVDNLINYMNNNEQHIDILVNNAGAAWGESLENFSEKGWDKIIDLNVKSMFFLSKKFIPLLKKKSNNEDPSRIINIGSIDGIGVPGFENYSYAISKSAVHHLTKILASKLVSEGIICNAIAPGPFPSKMLGSALLNDYTKTASKNPRKRIGTPEDIAGTVLFLSSRAGAYIVGQVIVCDGGIVNYRHKL